MPSFTSALLTFSLCKGNITSSAYSIKQAAFLPSVCGISPSFHKRSGGSICALKAIISNPL
jgi:hypothetical protein